MTDYNGDFTGGGSYLYDANPSIDKYCDSTFGARQYTMTGKVSPSGPWVSWVVYAAADMSGSQYGAGSVTFVDSSIYVLRTV